MAAVSPLHASHVKEYYDRVRVIMAKVNNEDETEKSKAIKKILIGLNEVGKTYFGEDYTNTITDSILDDDEEDDGDEEEDDGDEEEDDGDEEEEEEEDNAKYDMDKPIRALTKKAFIKQYEEDIGDEPDEDTAKEASFSDAFRHAAIVDVDTLNVIPLPKLADTDFIFTWKMINTVLPTELAGTRLVAIHIDTDDSPQFFFPIPDSLRVKRSKTSKKGKTASAKRSSSNKAMIGGSRKTHKHSRKCAK
jgi:hypothetical protein